MLSIIVFLFYIDINLGLLMCLWGPTKSENGMPVSLDDNKISEGILGTVDSKEKKPEGHEWSEDKFKPRDPNGDAEDNSLSLFQAQSAGDTGGGDRMAVNEQSEMAAQSVADQVCECFCFYKVNKNIM